MNQTVLQSLNQGLHDAFLQDERVVILGEDILDPYGGAFKVTRGLASAFQDRVFSSPISEAGITGLAAGMALRGLRPVVEIMFGDFLTLTTDQLLNHITKFPYMYNNQVRVPIVIRTPMGGRRGYGATHSQTLEKHFLGIPGLRVVAPCSFQNPTTPQGTPGELLKHAILVDDNPVLFIENKLLYATPLKSAHDLQEFDLTSIGSETTGPVYRLCIKGSPPPMLTLATYGYMAELAMQALRRLAFEFEIFGEIIVFTQLAPFELAPLAAALQKTHRLLAIEEGGFTLGWGAEVLARSLEAHTSWLYAKRVAALDQPLPAAIPLENLALPGVDQIVASARALLETL